MYCVLYSECPLREGLLYASCIYVNIVSCLSHGNHVCVVLMHSGCYSWLIAPQELPYPSGLEKYKWFGQFFLQGKVELYILAIHFCLNDFI